MVSVLTFYSDDLSSNPAEAYSFSVKIKKRPVLANNKKALLEMPSFVPKRYNNKQPCFSIKSIKRFKVLMQEKSLFFRLGLVGEVPKRP